MISELDRVVLTHNIEEYGLNQRDLGAVVHCYPNNAAYEVEFVTAIDGVTVALLTLKDGDIRALEEGEILHIRKLPEGFKRFIIT
jgi:hypothetical protein